MLSVGVMKCPTPYRPQTAADHEAILDLMRAYYAEEGYPFDAARASTLLNELRNDPCWGGVWVADLGGEVAAYVAVTMGRSFEYGGRDAFVDELFVAPAWRGNGLGTTAIQLAENLSIERGVAALHLEVEPHRHRAARLYRHRGYNSNGRTLMTKRFDPSDISDGTSTDALDLYDVDLARVHHEHFGHVARGAAEVLLEALHERGVESGAVVELACGTGVSALALTQAGFDVIGVDISPAMIAIATKHAPDAGFVTGSLWACPIDDCVAVTAIGEAFGYCSASVTPDAALLERRLETIWKGLRPGGVLLFDVAGPGRSGPSGRRTLMWNHDDSFVCLDEREDGDTATLTRTIDTFAPRGGLHRHRREVHRLSLFEPARVEQALNAVGFRSERLDRYAHFELPEGWTAFVATKE